MIVSFDTNILVYAGASVRAECRHHANRQTWYWRAAWFLLHAVMYKLLGDICREFLRCGDVGIAFDCLALLKFGKAASIEGTCQLRIEFAAPNYSR